MTARHLAAVLAGATALATLQAQQVRDNRPPVEGAGSVSGTVVTAAEPHTPVRRATVEVGGFEVLTDDDGSFTVGRLVKGTYFVQASKPGFIPASLGAKRPAGPGTAVEVISGRQVGGLVLRLFRGGVISGRVVDPGGHPAAGVVVQAFRDGIDELSGQRLPLPVSTGFAEMGTNDKGEYRFYGLEPGDYVVAAGGPAGSRPMRLTTAEDIRYATDLIGRFPGAPPDPASRPPEAVNTPRLGPGATVYFPSSESIAEAQRITLGPAEERQGIDVIRRRVPSGSVSGNVFGNVAAVRQGGKVFLVDRNSPLTVMKAWSDDGGFAFSDVPSGAYDIVATSDQGGFRGRAEAFVVQSDVALAISLDAGATVSGRIVFEAATGQRPESDDVRLSLRPATRADFPFGPTPITADNTFRWEGVPPGNYRLVVTTAANRQPGWRAKTAMVGGIDLLDTALTVPSMGVSDIVVTMSDARSSISGTLQAPDGTPVSDYSILVFSADHTFWRPGSRRTQLVRPTTSGGYALRDLPAGDYLLVALSDVDRGQWQSRAFLEELAPFALKLSLADGERKVQDMKLGGAGTYSTR